MADAGVTVDVVVMGQVIAPYGVHGELKIRPFSVDPATLAGHKTWLLRERSAEWRAVQASGVRIHADVLLARLDGVESREAAATLKGCEIGVTRSALPSPKAGEIYLADLVGMAVVNRAGVVLGDVTAVREFGAHPVLEVGPGQAAATAATRLIPYVAAHVDGVDREARRIEVDWGEDY